MNTLRSASRRAQRGVTLVELMVGTVLSLLVVLAVASLVLMQKRSYSTQDDSARMQESARMASSRLTRELRLAGYRDIQSGVSFAAPTFTGVNAAAGAPNASDSFEIHYYGASAPSGAADGSIVNCFGETVAATALQRSTYFIANDAGSGEPALFCGDGVRNTMLVPGVETMQILVGEDSGGTGGAGRYQPFGAGTPVEPRSVLIALLLRSPTAGHPAPTSPTFNLFGEAYAPAGAAPSTDAGAVFVAPSDGRIRKIVLLNIGLRNFLD
jgi:type IV pilus assembly protein PilW